jgi:hypothetical protein
MIVGELRLARAAALPLIRRPQSGHAAEATEIPLGRSSVFLAGVDRVDASGGFDNGSRLPDRFRTLFRVGLGGLVEA